MQAKRYSRKDGAGNAPPGLSLVEASGFKEGGCEEPGRILLKPKVGRKDFEVQTTTSASDPHFKRDPVIWNLTVKAWNPFSADHGGTLW